MKGTNGQLPKLRPDLRLYLFHGADEAGAADLAKRLAASLPDAERVDLDAVALRKDPGRLADEAASMSLFGDARLIRATGIGEESLAALTLLLDADRAGNPVIAVAPSVKASSKIVKLATDSPRAVAVACYAPSAADAERIAGTMLTDAGLRPAAGLARRIADAAGTDRAVMAQEVEKLALFLDAAPDRPHDASLADLDAIGADLGEAELAGAVDALIEGRPGNLGAALARLDEGGASPVPWLRAVQRRLVTLGEMRSAVDRGEPADAVMKRHRIFWREEAKTTGDLRRWSAGMIATALQRVRGAELAAMSSGTAGAVGAEHDAVALARRLADRR
ncbi:DNA polymerase III subunit delta [Sphingomonas sp.]|uniref:DNA polymerase III subunit delta n=1 Tax=Sphingomonas sp. TaxID=28214 RepID=UPI003B006767